MIKDNEIKKPNELVNAALTWLITSHGDYIDLLKQITKNIVMEPTSVLQQAQAIEDPEEHEQKMAGLRRGIAIQAALSGSKAREALNKEFAQQPAEVQQEALAQVKQEGGRAVSERGCPQRP